MIARAVPMLSILTGNVGVSGGNPGGREGTYGIPIVTMPTLTNPIKDSISVFLWTDAIERGPEMTALKDGVRGTEKIKVPIKFIWNYASNAPVSYTHLDVYKRQTCMFW